MAKIDPKPAPEAPGSGGASGLARTGLIKRSWKEEKMGNFGRIFEEKKEGKGAPGIWDFYPGVLGGDSRFWGVLGGQ